MAKETHNPNLGGARQSAGRPRMNRERVKQVSVYLTPTQAANNPNWGGARPGAGRPRMNRERVKQVSVYLTPTQAAKLKKLGGSKWVRTAIDAAEETPEIQLKK